jgi:hypothetical protein
LNDRPQKNTLGEMRDAGVRGILIYCADYRCSHSTAISADRWPDDVRQSHARLYLVGDPASMADPGIHCNL